MRLALLSPFPPSKSGIADYSVALADALAPLVPLTRIASASQLSALTDCDLALYQIGNNDAHDFVYETALRQPGVVVLHEANLHHLIAELTIKRGDWDAYMQAVEYDGGAPALAFAQAVRRLEVGPDYEGVPMLRRVLESARGLIIHSEYVASVARQYGYQGPLAVIPHGAWLPDTEGAPWRSKLGVPDAAPLIGIFGHLKPYKRVEESLRAFRHLVRIHPSARLILVGEEHPDFPLGRLLDGFDLRAHVRHIGFAPIEDFVGYMAACDIIVNLRYPTVGESSGSMLRALGLAKPVLVSEVGAFAEFPPSVCLQVPVGGMAEESLILEYLRYLIENPDAARSMGQSARDWVAEHCNWNRIADQYLEFSEQVISGAAAPAPLSPENLSLAPTQESAPRHSAKPTPNSAIKAEEVAPPPAQDLPLEPVLPQEPGHPLEADAETLADVETPAPFPAAELTLGNEQEQPQANPTTENVPPSGPPSDPPSSSEAPPDAPSQSLESTPTLDTTPPEDPASLEGSPELPDSDAAELAPSLPQLENPVARELLQWAPTEAARGYLLQHLSRLVETLDLLPDGEGTMRILEMGCYLQITPLLRTQKNYGEISGCYFGVLGNQSTQTAQSTDGRTFSCVVDEFDAELDTYPYADSHFDAVVCTELFEHLSSDPMHCLAEINRILKPDGYVLLSTPNVCSLRAIAAILGGYHPGFFPAFLKPNPDGPVDPRHHREYAPREIRQALLDAGFHVETLRTGPYWAAPAPEHAWVEHLLERYEVDRELRGECIFALGRKTSEVQRRYPGWLYCG